MVRGAIIVALLSVSSAAFAGKAKPLPASAHNPPIVLDEAISQVRLISRSDSGYGVTGHVELVGVTSGSDMARIDWKQKGKLLTSAKCDLSIDVDSKYAYGDCKNDDKLLKAKGALEAELIYWDDQEEKEYLVRTFKVNVHHWKGLGEVWQIVPDDVLASAWVWHANPETNNGTYRRPIFFFWVASDDALVGAVMRCTVNGTKLKDFETSTQSGAGDEIEADHIAKNGKTRHTYEWQRIKLMPDVMWGKRDTLKWDMKDTTPQGMVMSDNPGAWACQLRKEGKAIRQFLFTVGEDGMVKMDEMNTGAGAIPSVNPETVVMIDVRLTKDSKAYDSRINPAALKKSMGFGLPWPKHPKVKTIHASFPPKSGLPDPKK